MNEEKKRISLIAAWTLATIVISSAAYGVGAAKGQPSVFMRTVTRSSAPVADAGVANIGSPPPADIQTSADFNQFWDLWREIRERYYQQPVDEKKMFYGAMQGLAASVDDPYTVFFEPKAAEDFSQSLQGKFEGIGAEIGIKDHQLQVISPLPDTPAERAGLKPGDAILKINATDTTDMPVEKAVTLIRGKGGTKVVLTIGRIKTEKDKNGKEHSTATTTEIAIVRETIIVKSVRTKYLENGKVAHITISSFNQDTADLFRKSVDEVLAKKVKGIILDLRNDPGGYLDRATAIAGEWVGSDVVVKERRQGKIFDTLRGTGSGRLSNMPTIVLVNEGSASASEIVAGALQDYGKAKLVGMKTFGKGSVQDYSEFPDSSAVKITIAEWLTPKERSINKTGIDPDVKVDRTEQDYHDSKDPQLDKAIELLTGKRPTPVQAATKPKPAIRSSIRK